MSFLVRPLLLLPPEGESDLNRLELVSLRNREELDSLRDNIEVVVSDRVSSDELVLARNSPPRKNPPAAGERGLNMAASCRRGAMVGQVLLGPRVGLLRAQATYAAAGGHQPFGHIPRRYSA